MELCSFLQVFQGLLSLSKLNEYMTNSLYDLTWKEEKVNTEYIYMALTCGSEKEWNNYSNNKTY